VRAVVALTWQTELVCLSVCVCVCVCVCHAKTMSLSLFLSYYICLSASLQNSDHDRRQYN